MQVCMHVAMIGLITWPPFLYQNYYRMVKNVGGKKLWRTGTFEALAKKTLANPRLVCIF